MKYDRVTKQKWSENIDLTQELGYSYIYKRLHELEDKIEQGTLIELPCKVNDTVYWLIANKYIIECVVTLINISVGKKTHFTVWAKQKCEGVENDFSSDDLGEEWFLTREEAEKRLEELQE